MFEYVASFRLDYLRKERSISRQSDSSCMLNDVAIHWFVKCQLVEI